MAVYSPAASADDAVQVVSTGAVSLTDQSMQIDGSKHVGLRFPNVVIAQGSTVGSAVLTFAQYQSYSGLAANLDTTTLYGEKVANSAQFTTATNNVSARTRTTANLGQGTFGPDNTGFSANVTSIIQEIVNQGTWVSGNALSLLLIGNGSASGKWITPYLWDYFSGLYGAVLTISAGGGGGTSLPLKRQLIGQTVARGAFF